MKICKGLYVGEGAKKKKRLILRALNTGRIIPGFYLVSIASSGKEILDITPSFLMRPQALQDLQLIGIAATRDEAYEICRQIVTDVWKDTGGLEVRSYLETLTFAGEDISDSK